ncbi:enoyl-CoA hydratase-related protein [uncultured Albimonas sp.]|uniref:enoyl-CoA hydratase-related protein n=1 Tax=uncultured Albimonas sp. TaxID=1331701 RepID=UPI0030EDD75E
MAGSDAPDLVTTRTTEGVAVLTLNRPDEANAMTQPLWEAVHAAVCAAAADEAARVIVLTGAGKAFCAGADMKRLAGFARGEPMDVPETRPDPPVPGALDLPPGYDDRWSWLARVPKPIVAAINGPAVGSGFALAMFCDVRFAAAEAKLSTGFARMGLIGEMGLPWLLARIAGPHVAADLLFSARFVDGAEAERLGLVNNAVSGGGTLAAAEDYARSLAASTEPESLAVMKRQIYRGLVQSLDEAIDEVYPAMIESFGWQGFRRRATEIARKMGALE